MTKRVVQKRVVTETVASDGSKKTTIKENLPTKENKIKTPKKKRMTAGEREEMLIENFVGLQHAMTNLSIKFGSLTEQIVSLLRIYEESAINLTQGGKVNDKELLDKINSLLDQNKTIAKGLVMMEGKLRGRTGEMNEPETPNQNISLPQSSAINTLQQRSEQTRSFPTKNFAPSENENKDSERAKFFPKPLPRL